MYKSCVPVSLVFWELHWSRWNIYMYVCMYIQSESEKMSHFLKVVLFEVWIFNYGFHDMSWKIYSPSTFRYHFHLNPFMHDWTSDNLYKTAIFHLRQLTGWGIKQCIEQRQTDTHIHKHAREHKHTNVHAHRHTLTHTHTHTPHTHTHTHTHKYRKRRWIKTQTPFLLIHSCAWWSIPWKARRIMPPSWRTTSVSSMILLRSSSMFTGGLLKILAFKCPHKKKWRGFMCTSWWW